MSESPINSHDGERAELERQVALKQARKLRAQSEKNQTIWFGLGMMGLVGWSIAVPALVGIAIGLWIDSEWPSRYSWALMLLIMGVCIGCWNAWNWIERERSLTHPEPRDERKDSERGE